jgi:hypothetical protein
MRLKSNLGRVILVGAVLALLSASAHAQPANDQIIRLRADYAMRFLEPEPHMQLAKYFRDRGERLIAFSLLEQARRGRFEEPVFNHAFQIAFEGFDNSAAGEEALLKQLAETPQAADVIFKLADVYISRSDWPKAKQYLSAGLKLRPDDFRFTFGLAGVFSAEGNGEEANRVVKDFVRLYPQSEQGFASRIEDTIEKEPARAKAIAVEGRNKFPKSGQLAFDLGRILQSEKNLAEAERLFVEAAALAPESSAIQAWTGRFFYKVRTNNVRALEYYLNAYFLDPHAYETEFVESRIARISRELAESELEKRIKAGTPLENLVNDANSIVIQLALERMAAKWKPGYLELALQRLGHDDPGVRWLATEAIKKNVNRSFDEKLRALLAEPDLRKRGLAAYIAVYLWKEESFDVMKRMLTEEAQLLRYDAVSALMLEGGPAGLRLVLAHAAREPHPRLKKLIESAETTPD